MGKIKKWKSNIKKNRSDVARLNKMGRVVWEGGVSSMPKSQKKPGKKYKTVLVTNIFGKKERVTVEIKK